METPLPMQTGQLAERAADASYIEASIITRSPYSSWLDRFHAVYARLLALQLGTRMLIPCNPSRVAQTTLPSRDQAPHAFRSVRLGVLQATCGRKRGKP